MKPWARGRRFWNLYTQLGLRLSILLAYIIALSFLLHGSATLGGTYALSYSMVGISIIYNGGHVRRLHQLLAVERRPGQSSADVGCVICLEVAAVIATTAVGFGILVIDTDMWGLSECTFEGCEERKERCRAKAQYALDAAYCLWAVSALHFFLVIFVSIQCCVNKGLDRPESAINAARLQRAGNNNQGDSPNNENGGAEECDHELPAYRPPESTTSVVESRLTDEPPAYIERPAPPAFTGPAEDSTSYHHTR